MLKKLKNFAVQKAFDAIEKGNVTALRLFLKHGGVDPDSEGWRPCYHPYPLFTRNVDRGGHFPIEEGAFSLINYAIHKEQLGCMKVLLEFGANVHPDQGLLQKSPLHVLFSWYYQYAPIRRSSEYENMIAEMIELLLSYTDVTRFLSANDSNQEYLPSACECGFVEMLSTDDKVSSSLNPVNLLHGVNTNSLKQLLDAGFPVTSCSRDMSHDTLCTVWNSDDGLVPKIHMVLEAGYKIRDHQEFLDREIYMLHHLVPLATTVFPELVKRNIIALRNMTLSDIFPMRNISTERYLVDHLLEMDYPIAQAPYIYDKGGVFYVLEFLMYRGHFDAVKTLLDRGFCAELGICEEVLTSTETDASSRVRTVKIWPFALSREKTVFEVIRPFPTILSSAIVSCPELVKPVLDAGCQITSEHSTTWYIPEKLHKMRSIYMREHACDYTLAEKYLKPHHGDIYQYLLNHTIKPRSLVYQCRAVIVKRVHEPCYISISALNVPKSMKSYLLGELS